jgi:hypothetical protein
MELEIMFLFPKLVDISQITSIPKWERSMNKLKADIASAYNWIEELVPSTWIKAFSNLV